MTLYEKYKKLDIDFSQLGLEPGDTNGGYFCTPKGAEVIGWTGVDGIHCCFVKGFGEMVFAVNPSNLPGNYVHPLARSFEDFLRLILACGLDAAEQAWMWNRGEFDAFLETYPPDEKQQAVLETLAVVLALTPMDDPYGYIKEVQSSFDYGALKFSDEYYDLVGEPEPEGPPEKPEWAVYYEGGFGRHRGHDRPGLEIPLHKSFSWVGKVWHIPAAYVCGKGLVLDLCVEIDPGELWAFQEKWACAQGDKPLAPEDDMRRDAENPMNVNYRPTVTVNGRALGGRSGTGAGWVPMYLRPEDCRGDYNQQDWESIWLMEHYGLDPEKAWMFWRDSFPWATKTKPAVKTISLSLKGEPVFVPGPRFTVSEAGDRIPFTNPVTGEAHTLTVVEYEAQQMDAGRFQDKDQWEYPTHYAAMSFVVEPELPRQSLTVRDCGQGDRPRPKQSNLDGPTVASSVGVILAINKSGQPRATCSSLYFDPLERIEWWMVFYQKTAEDMEIDLLIS